MHLEWPLVELWLDLVSRYLGSLEGESCFDFAEWSWLIRELARVGAD
jgi:hypothetical protein